MTVYKTLHPNLAELRRMVAVVLEAIESSKNGQEAPKLPL
jgi:hypothetical protein